MPSEAISPSLSWSQRAAQQLRQLVERPMLLLVFLLAANAVARPYANVAHDTRLYSVQVINHAENGLFNNDLFFRYGSQDSFSLFSPLMAPLVKAFGLDWAFFLVYLAGTVILFAALIRLVCRLVDDKVIALLCLLYMAVAALEYGGHGLLHVHESFLTPRLLSIGLVLFGFDNLLQRRFAPSLACIVAGGLLHPLMAVGGLFVWAGVLMVDRFGWQRTTLIAGGLGLAAALVLAIPALGQRVFGTMDEEWLETVRRGSPFTFPSEWEARDWMNTILCLLAAAAGIALYHRDNPWLARFVAVLLVLGLAATLGNILAFNLPYALLIQGQPFRALWILKVFEVPICFMLAARLWRSGYFAQQCLALGLTVLFIDIGPPSPEWYAVVLTFPIVVVFIRGLGAKPRQTDWIMKSVALSLLASRVAWMLFLEALYLQIKNTLVQYIDLLEFIRIQLNVFGVVSWMLLFLGILLGFTRQGLRERSLGFTCVGAFLAVQLFFFFAPKSAYVRENASCYLPDVEFARNFIREQRGDARQLPTVYSCFGKIEYVWLEFKTNNYFDWWEAGGFIFKRAMAMEGQRRALLAGPFEVSRFRKLQGFLDDRAKLQIKRFFRRDLDSPEPTLSDLAQLCREPELDYAVLRHKFDNLYSATNGSVYVYDCRQVRAALKIAVPQPAIAVATGL